MTKTLKRWKTRAALWAVLFSLVTQTASTSTREVEQAGACAALNHQAVLSFSLRLFAPEGLVGDFNGDDLPDLLAGELSTNAAVFVPGDGTGLLDTAASIPLPKSLSSLVAGDFNNDAIPDVAGITYVDGRDYNLSLLFGDGTGRFRDSGLNFTLPGQASFTAADFNGDGKLDLAVSDFARDMVAVYLGDGTGRFASGMLASRTPRPVFLLAEDFNGDGKPDLAVVNYGPGSVTVLLNDGAARFTAAPATSVEAEPYFLLAEDFNRDGRRDLIVLKRTPSQFQYLLGDGTGRFLNLGGSDINGNARAAAGDLNQDGLPDLVAVSRTSTAAYLNNGGNGFANPLSINAPGGGPLTLADFNNDGKLDLVSAGADGGRGKIFIALGEGNGRFLTALTQTTTPAAGANAELADFNADGKLDLALITAASLTIQLGDGAGRFTPANIYSAGRFPLRTASQDFNGDGKLDLAVVVDVDNQVLLFWGDGRGGFSNGPNYPVGNGTSWLAAGDFNGDGKPDLAVNSYNNNNVLVLLNTSTGGTGSFAAPLTSPAGSNPRVLAPADFNGDGKLDLAVASIATFTGGSNTVSLLFGDGAGRFTANANSAVTLDASYRTRPLTVADFDGDGKPELAVTLEATVSTPTPFLLAVVKFSSGATGYTVATYPLDAVANGVVANDFNGDGRPDIAVANQDFSGVTLLFNDGQGRFARKAGYFIGPTSATLAGGDLNRDGRADLLITHSSTSGMSVLLSACAAAPLFVTTSAASYRSARLAPASIVSTFGAGLTDATEVATTLPLPTTLAGTSVLVKDAAGREARAPLFFVSPAQINYQLPAEAATGAAVITINRGDGSTTSGAARLDRVVPALFSADASGQGLAAAIVLRVKANGAQSFEPVVRYDAPAGRFVAVPIDVSDASEQVFLVLFGSGLRNRSALAAVTGALGGERAEVIFAGAQGNLVGADQINLRIPPQLAGRGEVGVVVTADGKTANTVRVSIK
jgi:uncharacterized protein (TIGR03437 family)